MLGWIKLYRDLLHKPIWTESTPEQKTILITLILMVNHQEKQWEWQGEPYNVTAGQVITSLESIVEKCGKGISIQNVRTAIKRFEKFGFLTNDSTNKNRLITINNWEDYQNNGDGLTSRLTGGQQSINNRLTTNKNDKKLKNDKEVTDSYCPKSKTYDEKSIPYQLALRLLNNIRENNPGFKEPNLQKWSDDFRLMIERDNRLPEEINTVIDWCQKDSFWKTNILSPSKLRKQYDQLVLKIQSSRDVKRNKGPQHISLERPSHWEEPKPITKDEFQKMKQWEDDLPF